MNTVSIRLNGWQRLWVAVTLMWLCVVLVLGYGLWPTSASVSKGDVYARMSEASAKWLIDFYDVLAAQAGGRSEQPDGFIPDKGETVDIGGHLVQFAAGATEADMKRVAGEYYAALRQALAARRIKFAVQSVAFFSVPAVCLYLFGWSVAWIRRGFADAERRDPVA
jgi:hypothetical protein